jgi:hypothetical protein
MSSSVDLGSVAQRSPSKMGASDTHRPQSSEGIWVPGEAGPALRESTKMISDLTHQIWQSKLELSFRRDQQAALEKKIEVLEAGKKEAEETNQRMVKEMEKRDKAIEEAVAMIVTLEARIEELTQERSRSRHIEAESVPALPTQETSLEIPSPRSKPLNVAKLEADAQILNRMPSFLSDRTENTENLRNVYLGARGSVVSLSQVTDAGLDNDNGTHLGLASPSLSVLSESSFVSVYGRKGEHQRIPSKVDEPLSLNGPASDIDGVGIRTASRTGSSNQRTGRSDSSRYQGQEQFQSMGSVVGGSPLQRIENLDPSLSQKRHTLRLSDSSKNLHAASNAKGNQSPNRVKTRQQKREEMRKVMTETPGGASLHDHGLPPTPDTISSATLRRLKNSDDTLSRRQRGADQQSQGSSLDLTSAHDIPVDGVPLHSATLPVQHYERALDSHTRVSLQQAASIPRPRSADETTVSNRRERRWSVDSEASGDSFESSLDIWLRAAGSRPKQVSGRASPDLFGFPVNPSKGGWSMDAMFGPASSYSNVAEVLPNNDQMRDLMSAQTALFGSTGPPPPPNRQSSMQAHTGVTGVAKPSGDHAARRRKRHTRRNSDDAQARAAMKTPVPEQFGPELAKQPAKGEQKRSNYPPIVSHQGPKSGLMRLWRRSIGSAPSAPSPEPNQAVAPAPVAVPAGDYADGSQSLGQPATWVNKNIAVEDDRTGATPPPILRNPRQRRESALEAEPSAPSTPITNYVEVTTPRTAIPPAIQIPPHARQQQQQQQQYQDQQPENSPVTGSATGSRRKWLPNFARSNSGKQRSG